VARQPFWPGFRWRVLAHRRTPKRVALDGVSCRHCGWAGTDVFVHCDKRKARPWPLKCGGDWARDLVWAHVVEMRSTDFGDRVEFDELVIDDWLHLEQMNRAAVVDRTRQRTQLPRHLGEY
jgi:hypothetical protein